MDNWQKNWKVKEFEEALKHDIILDDNSHNFQGDMEGNQSLYLHAQSLSLFIVKFLKTNSFEQKIKPSLVWVLQNNSSESMLYFSKYCTFYAGIVFKIFGQSFMKTFRILIRCLNFVESSVARSRILKRLRNFWELHDARI